MNLAPGLGLRMDVHVGDRDDRAALRSDVRAGLTSQPKWLPPKWLYDTAGCALFALITEVPEYYPTRNERSILARHSGAIARRSAADTLVELGSGNSDKTRLLLDALAGTGRLRRFIPFEISLGTLTAGAMATANAYPGMEVHGVAGDPTAEWIEMRLRACGRQSVHLADLDMTVDFADGEDLRTEVSARFRRHGIIGELAAAGLETVGWWTDVDGDYDAVVVHADEGRT